MADRGRRCRLTLAQGQLLGAMFDKLTNPLALFGGRRPGYNTHRHTSIWLSRLSGECRLIQPRELRGEKALTLPLSL